MVSRLKLSLALLAFLGSVAAVSAGPTVNDRPDALRGAGNDRIMESLIKLYSNRAVELNTGTDHNAVTAPAPHQDDTAESVCTKIALDGYICEMHHPNTTDGFILNLQHIVPMNGTVGAKGAVLLQHGIADSAATWVVNGKGVALPYILVDEGYDVWLSNSRGVVPMRHQKYTPCTEQMCWSWTFDDIAKFDLPAVIGYVRAHTGAPKLAAYIGHSQGTLVGFAAFERQEVADQVNTFVALAPVAYVNGFRENFNKTLERGIELICHRSWSGEKCSSSLFSTARRIASFSCHLTPRTCAKVVCGAAGCQSPALYDPYNFKSFLFYHYPMDTAFKNFEHFGQMQDSRLFKAFDWGTPELNIEHHGTPTPPMYYLADVKVKTALFSGDLDTLASPIDVDRLESELAADMNLGRTRLPYGHGDFVWSLNAKDLLYPSILKLLAERPVPTPAVV